MSRRLKPEKADAVRALAHAGRDQRTIATALGVSKGYVSSVLTAPRKARNAARMAAKAPTLPAVAPVPVAVVDPRLALQDALVRALTPEATAAAELALARFDDPALAAELDAGEGRVFALFCRYPIAILSRPQDLADLARLVSEEAPYGLEREDGESDEDFAACVREVAEREVERAAQLLEEAARIVRAEGPPARWGIAS